MNIEDVKKLHQELIVVRNRFEEMTEFDIYFALQIIYKSHPELKMEQDQIDADEKEAAVRRKLENAAL